MENSAPTSFLPTILSGLAAVATFLAIPISYFLGKRKQSADISEVNARTLKTQAEARQIDSAILLEAYTRLDELQDIIHSMSVKSTLDDQIKADLEWKVRRMPLLEMQLRKSLATLQANGIIFDENAGTAGAMPKKRPGKMLK